MIKQLALLLLIALSTVPATAQLAEPPLQGPLLASNTVAQDRIILYDVGSDRYRELALGMGAHHIWDFSPDGCRVLFTLMEGTNPARVYSARLDGSDLREMVRYDELPPERWGVWEPDWSPTGDVIAFTLIRDQSTASGIERVHHTAFVTTDDPTVQFYSVTGREFSPVWSPDGAWLAYVSYDERVAGVDVFSTAIPTAEPIEGQQPAPISTLIEADLWAVSADAATKYPLTNFQTGSVSQPRWSTDSQLLSFVYSPSSNNDTVWFIANAQNAIATQLSYGWALALDHTWLPDNTAIIAALRDFVDVSENILWNMPLTGNADENGTPFIPQADLRNADYPRFSPDGALLAARTGYELALVDVSTGEATLLDERTFGNSPAVWSPEGFTGEASCAA